MISTTTVISKRQVLRCCVRSTAAPGSLESYAALTRALGSDRRFPARRAARCTAIELGIFPGRIRFIEQGEGWR